VAPIGVVAVRPDVGPEVTAGCAELEGAGPRKAAMFPAFTGRGAAVAPGGGISTASMMFMKLCNQANS
jgi:hypothetical protein